MQRDAGANAFVHVDDGSVDAIDNAVVAFARAVDVAAEQLAAARANVLRCDRRIDMRAHAILVALADAETVDDLGAAQHAARELLGWGRP